MCRADVLGMAFALTLRRSLGETLAEMLSGARAAVSSSAAPAQAAGGSSGLS